MGALLLLLAVFSAACDAESRIEHVGDNSVDSEQSSDLESGAAISGSQVNSVLGGGSMFALNLSTDADARSGDLNGTNFADLFAGPEASASALFGHALAEIIHEGDNEVDSTQAIHLRSGDAVAGSQVNGISGGGDAHVVNVAEDSTARSGTVKGSNAVVVRAGPVARAVATGGDAKARIRHDGDNSARSAQRIAGRSGDALAGSQVTARAGSGSTTALNKSKDAEARSGDVSVHNTANVQSGPRAESRSERGPLPPPPPPT
ncbi:MAG TPA: hypothetical protein VNE62_07005 [Actinomycetota bacterium]|nr:hypothetical protein [Actinomycetota bacterium]